MSQSMFLLHFSTQFGLVCWKCGKCHGRSDGRSGEDFAQHQMLINASKKDEEPPCAW